MQANMYWECSQQVQLIITKNWKQPKCSSGIERINKSWHVCTTQYQQPRINKLQLQAITGDNPMRMMLLTKRNQMEWNIYHNTSITLKFKSRPVWRWWKPDRVVNHRGKGRRYSRNVQGCVLFLDLNDRYTVGNYSRYTSIAGASFLYVYFTSLNTLLKIVYDMSKLWGMMEMLCFKFVVITRSY